MELITLQIEQRIKSGPNWSWSQKVDISRPDETSPARPPLVERPSQPFHKAGAAMMAAAAP